jgi:ribulose-5-phosphate 4-epimerase/fuculose-1-phosphate aldolase
MGASVSSKSANKYSAAEWQMRVDLAACYRLADLYGFSDIIWNHITAKVPDSDHFLINRFGLRHDEITASNLITLDLDGNVTDPGSASGDIDDVNLTGYIIHSAIHAARPDLHCVMHSHSEYGLAVSALKDGLLPLVQDAMPFFEQVAYHDYEGMSTDTDERQRLASSLGDKNVMILRNHGLLTCGATVGEAFMLMYYLERSCKVQMRVLASGADVNLLPAEVCRNAAAQYELFPHGKYEWPALLRMLDQRASGFRE